MGSLEFLAPPILARILQLPGCEHMVVSLWKCGNRNLNNRLRLGGCKSFRTPPEVTRAKMWPRMLSCLHGLRSVCFTVEKVDEDLNTTVMAILQLKPAALRRLHVTMPGASYITTVEDPVLSAQAGHPVRVDLGARFPYLRELRMTEQGMNPVDTFLVWPNLPMALRTLEWSVVVYSSKAVNRNRLQTGNLFPMFLPPRLTTLKVRQKSTFLLCTRGSFFFFPYFSLLLPASGSHFYFHRFAIYLRFTYPNSHVSLLHAAN